MTTIVSVATVAGAVFLLVAWFIGAREGRDRSRREAGHGPKAVPAARRAAPEESLTRSEERQRKRRAEIREAVTRSDLT